MKAIRIHAYGGPEALKYEDVPVPVAGKGEARIESLRLADIFRARVVDSTTESFVFEMTGSSEKLNAFITLMEPLGLVEISRCRASCRAKSRR